jgi:hypothetical protein
VTQLATVYISIYTELTGVVLNYRATKCICPNVSALLLLLLLLLQMHCCCAGFAHIRFVHGGVRENELRNEHLTSL